MANVFVNLPAPAGDGVGAGINTSTLGRDRTITVQENFGGTVLIEASADGGTTWAQILAFTVAGKQTISIAADAMRVRRTGVPQIDPGLPNVDVGSNDDGGTYLALPAPAGEGVGASVNTSALGSFKTVTALGSFSGLVIVEVSEDNVSWAECFSFTGNGLLSNVVVAQFMRVRRVGVSLTAPGLPVVAVGAIPDPGGGAFPIGPAGGDLSGTYPNPLIARPRTAFVLRPGGVPGNNVYTTWASVVAAANAVEGPKQILFDLTLIAPPFVIPVGAWDMTDIELSGYLPANGSQIEVPEGVTFTNLRRISYALRLNFTGTTPPVTDLANGDLFVSFLGPELVASGAGPFISLSGLGAGDTVIFANVLASNIQTGANAFFDIPNAGSALFMAIFGSQIGQDTISGVAGSLLGFAFFVEGGLVSPVQSGFAGTQVNVPFVLTKWVPDPTVYAGAVIPSVGVVTKFDTTAGAISATIQASGLAYPGDTVWVKKVGGTNPLVLSPSGGDTFDNGATASVILDSPTASALFIRDDFGNTNWNVCVLDDDEQVPGEISGLQLSYASASTVEIAAGSCRSDDNADNIVSGGTLTADITVAGANGLDAGVEAANTWYAVWIIDDPTGANPVASLLSTSFTAPTMPAGYTTKRRVGAVRNDAASDFIPFVQRWNGHTRRYWYETARANLQVLTGGSATVFTAVPLDSLVPPSSQNALLFWSFSIPLVGGNVTDEFELRRTGSTVADGPLGIRPGVLTPGSSMRGQGEIPTDSSQSIDYLVSDADDDLDLYVAGFDDEF